MFLYTMPTIEVAPNCRHQFSMGFKVRWLHCINTSSIQISHLQFVCILEYIYVTLKWQSTTKSIFRTIFLQVILNHPIIFIIHHSYTIRTGTCRTKNTNTQHNWSAAALFCRDGIWLTKLLFNLCHIVLDINLDKYLNSGFIWMIWMFVIHRF